MPVCDVVCICGHSICNHNKCECDLYQGTTADEIKQPGKIQEMRHECFPLRVGYRRVPGSNRGDMPEVSPYTSSYSNERTPEDHGQNQGTQLRTCFFSFFSSKLLHLQLSHALDAGRNKFGNGTNKQQNVGKKPHKNRQQREIILNLPAITGRGLGIS